MLYVLMCILDKDAQIETESQGGPLETELDHSTRASILSPFATPIIRDDSSDQEKDSDDPNSLLWRNAYISDGLKKVKR